MHRAYTLEEKAQALDLLHEKGGDVPYVSYLTGISERTLYSWRKHIKYAQMEQGESPQPLHWVRQHPERQERLQQQREKRLQQQQQRDMQSLRAAGGVQSLRAADTGEQSLRAADTGEQSLRAADTGEQSANPEAGTGGDVRHFAPSSEGLGLGFAPTQMTAFGISQEELEEALKVEYIDSPYTNLHADLLLHLQHLNFSLTDEPENAHRKALAFSRIFETAQQIEEIIRIEKPQLTIFKYEYPDKTYHDVPFWSNAVYERAQQAFDAVIAEAKRQYEEQQAALNPRPPMPELFPAPSPTETDPQPTLEELLTMPFTPDDFIPKHTGYHKYFFGEDPYARYKQSGTESEQHTENPSE